MKDNKGSIFIVFFLFFGAAFVTTINASFDMATNEIISLNSGNHPPIYIEGNDGFTSENGVTGGSGTEEDPYIIENWVIVGDGAVDNGIFINNTDVYFTIRNCTISNFSGRLNKGILLSHVENGKVEKSKTFGNYYGISIRNESSHVKIINFTSYNYSSYMAAGISCSYSSNITINSCVVFNKDYGIYLFETSHVDIEKSICYNNSDIGILIYGKQIKYTTIKECKIFLNGYHGIMAEGDYDLSHSTYIHIANCEIHDNGLPEPGMANGFDGIHISNYHDNIIENSSIYHNWEGIFIAASMNNIIRNCSIYDHNHNTLFLPAGVYLGGIGLLPIFEIKKANELSNCDIYNNDIGILLDVTKTKIYKNNIFNHEHQGITVVLFCRAQIKYNNIYDNGFGNNNLTDIEVTRLSLVDLRHNYWGSFDGPSGVGPGNGDSLVRKFSIAIFRPWEQEPIPDAGIN